MAVEKEKMESRSVMLLPETIAALTRRGIAEDRGWTVVLRRLAERETHTGHAAPEAEARRLEVLREEEARRVTPDRRRKRRASEPQRRRREGDVPNVSPSPRRKPSSAPTLLLRAA